MKRPVERSHHTTNSVKQAWKSWTERLPTGMFDSKRSQAILNGKGAMQKVGELAESRAWGNGGGGKQHLMKAIGDISANGNFFFLKRGGRNHRGGSGGERKKELGWEEERKIQRGESSR